MTMVYISVGYIAADGKPKGEPLMPPGMRELIRSDMDKGFDFAEGLPSDMIAESEQAASRDTSTSGK